MTLYGPGALERSMKIQEVILRAMSGELNRWRQNFWRSISFSPLEQAFIRISPVAGSYTRTSYFSGR